VDRQVKDRELSGAQYIQALLLLLRLRQGWPVIIPLDFSCHYFDQRPAACVHPYLVTKGADNDALQIEDTKRDEDPVQADIDDLASALQGLDVKESKKCVVCDKPISSSSLLNFCEACSADVAAETNPESSTKIRKVLSILETIRKEDPSKKTIIFSQVFVFLALRLHRLN
jgi:hypothetical protein